MKKIIALCAAISLLFSASVSAFATDHTGKPNENTHESVIYSASGNQYVFRSIDLDNGDVQIFLIYDGEIVENTYVDRLSRRITTEIGDKIYVMNVAESIEAEEIETPATSLASYSSVGTIRYRYGSGDLCGLKLSMRTETDPNSSYDVCGTYRGISQFAGVLVTLFNWPGAVAVEVAEWVLYVLGINALLSSFDIPSFVIKASATTNYWKIVDIDNPSNHYKELYGTKYISTNTKYGSKTYYGGTCDYFTKSDFTQRNTLMATQFYDEMFAFYPWEVYSWT